MSPRPIKEALQRVRARIESPDRWTQRAYARASNGASIPPRHPDACCWCLGGAALVECPDVLTLRMGVYSAISRAITSSTDLVRDSLPAINDSHTHAEVLAILDKAIEAAL